MRSAAVGLVKLRDVLTASTDAIFTFTAEWIRTETLYCFSTGGLNSQEGLLAPFDTFFSFTITAIKPEVIFDFVKLFQGFGSF